jgi:hypothetical protein
MGILTLSPNILKAMDERRHLHMGIIIQVTVHPLLGRHRSSPTL